MKKRREEDKNKIDESRIFQCPLKADHPSITDMYVPKISDSQDNYIRHSLN